VLDVRDKALFFDYTGQDTPVDDVTALIASGRNGGSWTGSGIITSLASANLKTLGVADDGNGTVTVKYTYGGDANLDGKINVDDYGKIDFNVAAGTRLDQRRLQLRRQDQRRRLRHHRLQRRHPGPAADGAAAAVGPVTPLFGHASAAVVDPRRDENSVVLDVLS
jgi:hypothetical protein